MTLPIPDRSAPRFRSSSRRILPAILLFLLTGTAPAQIAPTLTVDEECTAFAYAPDGRIAYAVRHILKTKRLELQRDDIWLVSLDGKRRRIVNGEKLVRGTAAFSYAVHSLRWAPDGARLTAELLTSQMVDERGNTQEGVLTLLFDQDGREIKIAGADSVIPDGTQAAWLAEGVTVVYLVEAVKPGLLHSIKYVRPVAGRGGALFSEHAFAAVAWRTQQNAAVAIERDRSLSGSPRLVELDLAKETYRQLATLDSFAGALSISPSGTKVAYFRDQDVLEIRDLTSPDRVARIRVAYGSYHWAHDERRILIKRGLERRSGDLVWINLPPLGAPAPGQKNGVSPAVEAEPQPVLHGLTFRNFELSPDGRWIAVIQPGKHKLLVYPAQ